MYKWSFIMNVETPKNQGDLEARKKTSDQPRHLADVRIQIEKSLQPADQPSLLENGIIVGDGYRIVRLIAEGGMSDIYQATHQQHGNTALKVVHVGNIKNLDRLRAEEEIMSKLKHENIAGVYSSFNHGSHFFVVMELLGDSLAHHEFENHRKLAEVFSSLARVSHYIHGQGIIHRDLTPENVLFNGETPKITDFGLAVSYRQNPDSLTPNTGLGTICYVSPEQAEGIEPVGPQTDIYSLGAMFYECLAKEPRFPSLNWENAVAILRKEVPPPPSFFDRNISRTLDAICLKCMEIRPEDRYATANDLAIALDSFSQNDDQSDFA